MEKKIPLEKVDIEVEKVENQSKSHNCTTPPAERSGHILHPVNPFFSTPTHPFFSVRVVEGVAEEVVLDGTASLPLGILQVILLGEPATFAGRAVDLRTVFRLRALVLLGFAGVAPGVNNP